jgi:hypothetical protein
VAIPCAACGQPVHDRAVKCPHCGDLTGVPVDPLAVAEARATTSAAVLPDEALDARVANAIVAALRALAELVARDGDDDPLPRATARRKRS